MTCTVSLAEYFTRYVYRCVIVPTILLPTGLIHMGQDHRAVLGAHWHVSSESRLLTNRKQTDNIVRPLRCEMDDLRGRVHGATVLYTVHGGAQPW